MFEKVMVALDMSPSEKPILACLPALTQWGVRHVTLAHVIQLGYLQGAPLAHEQDYIDWLERSALPLRDAGLRVDVVVRGSGQPAAEILTLMKQGCLDLLVIGSRGQNLLKKMFLGSVARELIRQTCVPVLLEWIEPVVEKNRTVCAAVCTDPLRYVLLATDFSESAAGAEHVALMLAGKAGHIECVHVLTSAGEKQGVTPEVAAKSLEGIRQRLVQVGGKASVTLLEGKACQQIAGQAADHDASLIIVGKYGQGKLASMVIGSTVATLCEQAGRPVLVIP